jgi:hypothetical protein
VGLLVTLGKKTIPLFCFLAILAKKRFRFFAKKVVAPSPIGTVSCYGTDTYLFIQVMLNKYSQNSLS